MSLPSLPALPVEFGRYELRALLGRGGMGEVYRALDRRLGREVAIKVLPGDLASEPEYRQRFGREAELAAQLNDPHVIPIHRFGERDGRLYLEMRLVEGTDLGVLIEAEPLDPAEAVLIVEQVAGALDAAHKAGLVHRDVKPSNVLVAGRGTARGPFAYLCDFGIARPVRSASPTLTPSGFLVGTLAYMGPERFGPAEPDTRTDVYALACLLFAALVGEVPFPYEEPAAVIAAHLNERPPRPSLARAGVPTGMDAVVARGMAKRPADRYASAGELARAARAALDTPARGSATGSTRSPLADPSAAMLALAAGGAAWVVLPNGPAAVPIGLGVAAVVFGTKVAAETLLAVVARRRRSSGSQASRTTRIDGQG